MAPTQLDAFASKQLELLEAERTAEANATTELLSCHAPPALQRAGLAVTNLTLAAMRTGPGGKTIVELEPDGATNVAGNIPAHGIRVGDIVRVAEMPSGSAKKKEKTDKESAGADGVVSRVQEGRIAVVLEKEDDEVTSGKRVWLVKLANDVTYKRMNQSMVKLEKMPESDMSPLTSVLFGHSSVTPVSDSDLKTLEAKIKWPDESLNESQKAAVLFALASPELALIHGPPGTGKTHTLITIILQSLKQDKRILVCGPSNVSVDNICDRLSSHGVSMVRIGHPARLLPSVINHSLDVLTHTSDAGGIVKDIRRDMDNIQASLRKKITYKERRAAYGELKILRKEYREREKKCVTDLVRGSRVVLCTLHGGGGWQLNNDKFDMVIVDEASQALEAQTWIPILWGAAKKLILAGDHLQLPPTIKSLNHKSSGDEAANVEKQAKNEVFTLERTMFDRLLDLHGNKIKKMLTTQYRMHEKIMAFPSSELYESKLIAAESVKAHLLTDLPYEVQVTDETQEPLVFYDTQGGDFPETAEEDDTTKKSLSLGDSKSNSGEAAIARQHVAALVAAGVLPSDIAVVTPYNAQLALLSRILKDEFVGIELGSVDGFQGREKEAVIVSLVRSGGEVGFLAERRRLNVSMTRPKRHLCVIGDSATLSKGGQFLKRWMAHLEEHADLRYPNINDLDIPER